MINHFYHHSCFRIFNVVAEATLNKSAEIEKSNEKKSASLVFLVFRLPI